MNGEGKHEEKAYILSQHPQFSDWTKPLLAEIVGVKSLKRPVCKEAWWYIGKRHSERFCFVVRFDDGVEKYEPMSIGGRPVHVLAATWIGREHDIQGGKEDNRV